MQHRVLVHGCGGTAQVIVPVGRPFNLADVAAVDLRDRLRGWLRLLPSLRTHQIFVLVGPRLVVVLEFRQVRVMEQRRQFLDAPASFWLQIAGFGALPAAFPLLLIFPGAWITQTRAGLDVVEPDVLGAFTVGPCLLAGDRTSMAANALVQVHDHGNLGHDFH